MNKAQIWLLGVFADHARLSGKMIFGVTALQVFALIVAQMLLDRLNVVAVNANLLRTQQRRLVMMTLFFSGNYAQQVIIVYKDGSYKIVSKNESWEYENDLD